MPYKDKNKAREYQRIYQISWRKKNPELSRKISVKHYKKNGNKYQKLWQSKNREKNAFSSREYAKNNPLKWKVGMITRLNWEKDKNCGICKSTKRLGHHHWRYRLPVQRKDFSTLCSECHGIQHSKRRFE